MNCEIQRNIAGKEKPQIFFAGHQHCRLSPHCRVASLQQAAARAGNRGCRVPVVPGVPDGSVTAEFVALQLVEGMLAVGVFSSLQHLGGQVSLLIKTPPAALLSLGSPRHLEQRQASETSSSGRAASPWLDRGSTFRHCHACGSHSGRGEGR